MIPRWAAVVILCAGWDGPGICTADALPQPAVAIGDTPEAVIERHIQAVGGRERLEAIATQYLQLDAREGKEPFELTVQLSGLLPSQPFGEDARLHVPGGT